MPLSNVNNVRVTVTPGASTAVVGPQFATPSTRRSFRAASKIAPLRHAGAYWRARSKAGEPVDAAIINTTSSSGIYGNAGQANYGAAKAGIAGLTVIAARELGRYGVTVNAVAPAALTRMTEGLGLGSPTRNHRTSTRRRRQHRPARRLARSATEARGITGRVFNVRGGVISVAEGWQPGRASTRAALGPGRARRDRPGLADKAAPNACTTAARQAGRQPMALDHDASASSPRPGRELLDLQGRPALRPGRRRRADDPLQELAFTTENTGGVAQQVLPTYRRAARPGRRRPASIGDFNRAMLVHGEQAFELHRPLPRRAGRCAAPPRSPASTTRARARWS